MAGKRRRENEIGVFMVRNMAAVMERERENRQLGKVEFAKACKITAPSYLAILSGTANPTLFMVTRIAQALAIPVHELLFGDRP